MIFFFPNLASVCTWHCPCLIKSLEWSQILSVYCMNNFSGSSFSDKAACVICEDLLVT